MTTIVPAGVSPTGERVERVIDGVGTIVFENYAAGEWMTKKGEPAKKARRRYLLDGEEVDSVSSIVATLDKPALRRWIEDQATRGAVQAERLGELADVYEEDWVNRVKLLGLGASAKRDEGADRGLVIHSAFHKLGVDGTAPNPADFSAIARPWVQAAMRAWLALSPEMLEAESIICNPMLRYGGRPDLVAKVDGKVTLLDYKTSKSGRIYEQAHYQTQLYRMALHECGIPVEQVKLIGIGNDGAFEVVDCAVTEEDARALVHVYRSRKRVNAAMADQRRILKAAANG